ncbi:hypothetical protein BIY24_04345 [Halobacteriovorax marinus]|uniref:hypothetical protein n=1 Tax=Halobacteriovorax marinus TaxID=97084 RepID=UPI000BC3178B|nr:hypothetical protein [Halobacteriovorax marinus]ATH07193.1 hypothetical protein BIY24_04345 [Halobacteriovorax marinus]
MKYFLITLLLSFSSHAETVDIVRHFIIKDRLGSSLSFVKAFEGRISLFTNRELKGKPVGSFSSRDLKLANETICKLREDDLEELKIDSYSMDFHRTGKSLFCDYNIHKGRITSGRLKIYFSENIGDIYGFKSSLVKGEDTYYFRLPGEVKAITDSVESEVIYKGKRLAVIRPSAKDVFEKFVLKDESIVSYMDRLKKIIKQKNAELILKEMSRCISDKRRRENDLEANRKFLNEGFPTTKNREDIPHALPESANYTSFQDFLNKEEERVLNLFKADSKKLEVYLKFRENRIYNVSLRLRMSAGPTLKIRKQDNSCIYLSSFFPWSFDDELWR